MSDYNAACAKQEQAFKTFDGIRHLYRAGLIGHEAFLAAKRTYDADLAEYDIAFAAASDIETSDT